MKLKEFKVENVKHLKLLDGEEIYRLTAPGPNGGLFDVAGFTGDNIWASGGPMAPFDTEFYLVLSAQSGLSFTFFPPFS